MTLISTIWNSSRSTKLLIASLLLNVSMFIGGFIVLQYFGGVKYLLIRLERAKDGVEYTDQVSQYTLLPDIENEIIFLGNSITFRGQWAELFHSRCINRGIGGDDSNLILNRLDEVIARKPAKIFVMIGINDLGKDRSIAYIIKNYDVVVKRLSIETSATQIYLQSVIPINNTIRNHRRNNEDIKALNAQIERLAIKYNVKYIDLFSRFIDHQGQLDKALTTDGIHINGKGYMLWREIIYKHVMSSDITNAR